MKAILNQLEDANRLRQAMIFCVRNPKKLKPNPRLDLALDRNQLDSYSQLLVNNRLLNKRFLSLAVRNKIRERMMEGIESKESVRILFESRVLDVVFPRMKRLRNFVQHDQYHFFPADRHLYQVYDRVLSHLDPQEGSNRVKQVKSHFRKVDREILLWTAIYHDIAKGSGGDHSQKGAKWVKQDLERFGRPVAVINEVQWLVENHLCLAVWAFRSSLESPRVLAEVERAELNPERLKRLLVFTICDIQGTHPKMWNDWKEKLLFETFEQLIQFVSSRRNSFAEMNQLEKSLGSRIINKDWQHCLSLDRADWLVVQKENEVWLRYFNPKSEQGLLAGVLGQIFETGALVGQALITTTEGGQVYDWFRVQGGLDPRSLQERLMRLRPFQSELTQAHEWKELHLDRIGDGRFALTLRGPDARGLLWRTCSVLTKMDLDILSVRALTWGQKAEDHFVVRGESDANLSDLKEKLISALILKT